MCISLTSLPPLIPRTSNHKTNLWIFNFMTRWSMVLIQSKPNIYVMVWMSLYKCKVFSKLIGLIVNNMHHRPSINMCSLMWGYIHDVMLWCVVRWPRRTCMLLASLWYIAKLYPYMVPIVSAQSAVSIYSWMVPALVCLVAHTWSICMWSKLKL